MNVSPLVKFLTSNVESKEKAGKFFQFLIKFYLIDHESDQLASVMQQLGWARQLMRFSKTIMSYQDLRSALMSDNFPRKLLHSIAILHGLADDLNILRALGLPLPEPIDAISRQVMLFFFLKSAVALAIALEDIRYRKEETNEKQLQALRFLCNIIHSTYALQWQHSDKFSCLAICLSAIISLRGEAKKVDWKYK